MQGEEQEFVDLLEERRKDHDIMWVSRTMKPMAPHKLLPELIYTRKQAIEAVLANPRVLDIMKTETSNLRNISKSIMKEAQDMIHEMASKDHLTTVRWLGLVITKILKRILITIRLNESLLFRIKSQMCMVQSQYVYAPTHRSYLDFVLLSYILFSYSMALPNIASGMDFYKMKIIGELLRHAGAFYMRRSFSSDSLYKEIFRAYVGSLVAHSDRALEFFIEGTRSRSQKTLSPKFGLLSTILEGLFRSNVPDVQFIPISISYDKPLEELLFVYELLGVPKPPESTSGLFRSLSILHETFSHGHVYLKISPPISARQYLDMEIRKASALSPHAKLPSEITEKVAYAIIDCHKRNTVLTPFNLISLLYNEKIHSHPTEFYTLPDLIQDYQWFKNVLEETFKAIINPSTSNDLTETKEHANKQEILNSLETHKNLMEFDSHKYLQLKNRHISIAPLNSIKGYQLSEKTLKIAVPVINLTIYINPIFAYLTKSTIAALCINLLSKEKARERYLMLRSLFSLEFALPTNMSDFEILNEFDETIELLTTQNDNSYPNADNKNNNFTKFYSILCNLIMPYVASLYIICETLIQWKNSIHCVEKNVIKECQRRVEESLFDKSTFINHPYSLCLDIYTSLLSSLVTHGKVIIDKHGFYVPNRINLTAIHTDLEDILNQHAANGCYLEILPLLIPTEIPNVQAKL